VVRAGTALDKVIGGAHHYIKNVDPVTMGVVGGALGGDQQKITRVIGGTKKSLASYEELRRGLVGDRANGSTSFIPPKL
jgi:hypothetical protein